MRTSAALLALVVGVSACAEAPATSPPEASPSQTATSATASPRPAEPSRTQSATPEPEATPEPVATLLAAGDIASCELEMDSATAALIAERDGVVATTGDHAYPAGNDATYVECYGQAWGAFLDRTRPTPGNHDLQDDGGAAYWRYFGERAGTPGEGWYSYEVGDWHVVALNSNCELIPCGPGSPQYEWLVDDLAASDARCTLAHMHHPRFSSGPHGDYPPVGPLWDALHADGTELVLVGHDHFYERMAPQTPAGATDPNGIRQLTAGTGGYHLYQRERIAPNSELIIDDAHGIVELTLRPDGYDWAFLKTDGSRPDSGSAACH